MVASGLCADLGDRSPPFGGAGAQPSGQWARGAFALRTVMSPPWSLRILAESPLTLMAIVKGEAWIAHDRGETVRLGPGDIAVTRAPDHYTVADGPATPPMKFVTGWRLALAADLLCEPDETVGTVARKVGYSSPFALSAAFKRVRGISPQDHRNSAMASA